MLRTTALEMSNPNPSALKIDLLVRFDRCLDEHQYEVCTVRSLLRETVAQDALYESGDCAGLHGGWNEKHENGSRPPEF